jgi:hypothetical protein
MECLRGLTNEQRLGCDDTVGSPPLELGESWGSSYLVCFYGHPASQARRSWRKVPLPCVGSYVGPREMGQLDLEHMVTWAHQDWGIPFFMASLCYQATQILVSTGICAILAWNSPSRTVHCGPHCGEQAALISASHPDFLISGCGTSGLAR